MLLDFMGGRREGVTLVERLRQFNPTTPIVAFTEAANWRAVSALLDGNVAGALPKPFDLDTDLVPLLHRLFDPEPGDS